MLFGMLVVADQIDMRDPDQRTEMVDAVADSIDDYFSQTTKLAAR